MLNDCISQHMPGDWGPRICRNFCFLTLSQMERAGTDEGGGERNSPRVCSTRQGITRPLVQQCSVVHTGAQLVAGGGVVPRAVRAGGAVVLARRAEPAAGAAAHAGVEPGGVARAVAAARAGGGAGTRADALAVAAVVAGDARAAAAVPVPRPEANAGDRVSVWRTPMELSPSQRWKL